MDTALIASASKPVIGRLIDAATGPLRARMVLWGNQLKMHDFAETLQQLTQVRTIWSTTTSKSIHEFYYPTRLIFAAGVSEEVGLSKLKGSCIIQGTVGQGKSILLRYFYAEAIEQLAQLGRIPVFVSLNRIGEFNLSLPQLICRSAKECGLEMDPEILELAVATNAILLLLDGFDEVPANAVGTVTGDIELLARKNPALQIIVSSRPGAIRGLPWFRVLPISPLQRADAEPFIRRICSVEAADRVIETLSSLPLEIGLPDMLSTPLLLTLFALVTTAEGRAPQSKIDFYQELFYLYFIRHDATKPGFTRSHPLALGLTASRVAFDAFSFHARRNGWLQLNERQFEGCVQFASEQAANPLDVALFRSEFTVSTPLLEDDGTTCVFIHKSIAEYHAARFISSISDESVKLFYETCSSNELLAQNFAVELDFLEDLDSFRYSRYYFCPRLAKQLKHFRVPASTDAPHVRDHLGRHGLPMVEGYASATSISWFDRLLSDSLDAQIACCNPALREGAHVAQSRLQSLLARRVPPRAPNVSELLSEPEVAEYVLAVFRSAILHLHEVLQRQEARIVSERNLWKWSEGLTQA